MKLYKIQSNGECGIYRNFYEYPRLNEIANKPDQYTVTECYLNKSGRIHVFREISTKNYSGIIGEISHNISRATSLENKITEIVYPGRRHRTIRYREDGILEAVADFMTRTAFKDGQDIAEPELVIANGQRYSERYFTGPTIITEEKSFTLISLEDVKKFEFADDDGRILHMIALMNIHMPEWRKPCLNTRKLKDMIETHPSFDGYVNIEWSENFWVPKYIKFNPNGIMVDIGRDLLVQ